MTAVSPDIKTKLESLLDTPIIKLTSLDGGCSYPSYVAKTETSTFFIKTNEEPTQTFQFEATGLQQLRNDFKNIPATHSFSPQTLVLDFIETEEPQVQFWESLGEGLAKLHKKEHDTFGFFEDNTIGAASQKNIATSEAQKNWPLFFWENRIVYKLEQIKSRYQTELPTELLNTLKARILEQLSSHKVFPSLVHGDLWSGNILCGVGQEAYLIDPAVYFGDRETDIAMSECFGGFAPEFYQSYKQTFPLESGYEQRKHIYNLYHMLNHQLIFGDSYKGSVDSIIQMICE